jgi:hypothetical protein
VARTVKVSGELAKSAELAQPGRGGDVEGAHRDGNL